MPNRLGHESSPYLLQHANNPVDWYPWGPEALARAKQEQKPIFLSIGYSACHWCHVMEHESFEDDEIASFLNSHFVCIKVDREERPDLDQIYMNAVQLMTGEGGWPMSVFLTPDLQPFFGGTYWPPRPSRGRPGFLQVIGAVEDAWRNRRPQAVEQAAEMTRHLQGVGSGSGEPGKLDQEVLVAAAVKLEQTFDFRHGGFGGSPKFPRSMDLQVLLRVWRRTRRAGLRDMVVLTLEKMARGGIYDHLAGGFARYSVDKQWLVPHFEKMLYDNALLTLAYLEAFQVTGREDFARVVRETADYILTYMTDSAGGFHSTEDADSEGEEGKFYLWTPAEIEAVLGVEAAQRFCYVYDVTDGGNFEGKNILNLPKTLEQCAGLRSWDLPALRQELADSRRKLLAARDQRVRPGKDDKVLVSWNALMIDALARAANVLNEPSYLEAAQRAARFVLTSMKRADGGLWHTYRHGQAKLAAYLDDYTYLIQALISLYETSFDEAWIESAVQFAELVLQHFGDENSGGFFYTADDHEPLVARNKDYYDSSVPSGNAMAATALLRLGKLCGREDFTEAGRQTLQSGSGLLRQFPNAAGQMLLALDFALGPTPEMVLLAGRNWQEAQELLREFNRGFQPNRVLAFRGTYPVSHHGSPLDRLFEGKQGREAEPVMFLCEDYTCQAPIIGGKAIRATWQELLAAEADTPAVRGQ